MPNTRAMITEANLQDLGYSFGVSASLVCSSSLALSLRILVFADIVALSSKFMDSFVENMSKYLISK
jgi:hypothetical protein